MKTTAIFQEQSGTGIGLELSEFELTALVALVEEGQERLRGREQATDLYRAIDLVADQFCSLLAHLELAETGD